jgi:hypothetical protein
MHQTLPFFWFALMHKGDSHLDLSVEHSNVTETLKLVLQDLLMMFRYWVQSTTVLVRSSR